MLSRIPSSGESTADDSIAMKLHNNSHFRMVKIQNCIKWICIIVGLLASIIGAYFHYQNQTTIPATVEVKHISNGTQNGRPTIPNRDATVEANGAQ